VSVLLTLELNQVASDWHTRVVTLSEAKGLGVRFFAVLRMTVLKRLIIKRTNVLYSGLREGQRPRNLEIREAELSAS